MLLHHSCTITLFHFKAALFYCVHVCVLLLCLVLNCIYEYDHIRKATEHLQNRPPYRLFYKAH